MIIYDKMSPCYRKDLILLKKVLALIICVMLCCVGFVGCDKKSTSADPSGNGGSNSKYSKGIHHAEIVVKDYGTIKLELDADTAPITVQNFCDLANSGFYDGLTFHRVYAGFVIQGGDPDHNGTGGSDKEIKGEFAANGVKNDIAHVRGVISMARATPYDSASSQFFICHQDARSSLDGLYAGFGRVTEGMDIVDRICQDTPVIDYNGTVEFKHQPIITTIKIVD